MVAVVNGQGLGLFNSSLNLLGNFGPQGNSQLGRSGEQVLVNSSTSYLVIRDQDECLAELTRLGRTLLKVDNVGGGARWERQISLFARGLRVARRFGRLVDRPEKRPIRSANEKRLLARVSPNA